jgi:universal stress protein A
MKIKKILFPTDFSEAAEKAFEYALFLADSHNAELIFLHVVDQLHGFTHYEILSLTPMEIVERMVKRAHENLQELVERAKDTAGATESVREGKTWDVICKTASEQNADIIVMASQGRTGLSHALIGSVAETVARHASCPVLIVRDKTADA